MTRIITAAALAVALGATSLTAAYAHHGWSWTTGQNIRLTGIITSAQLGNPHGIITVDAEGDVWTVEVGQPWRNARAGLEDSDFAEGTEITVEGEPSADLADRRLKAERITLSGVVHELYPNRS